MPTLYVESSIDSNVSCAEKALCFATDTKNSTSCGHLGYGNHIITIYIRLLGCHLLPKVTVDPDIIFHVYHAQINEI